jgi:hypothetical protein
LRNILGRLGLVALVAIGCSNDSDVEHQPSGETSGVGRIRLGEPFPEMDLVDADGAAVSPATWRGGWSAVALCPLTAPACLENLPEWESHRRIWTDLGLELIVITDRGSGETVDPKRIGGHILQSRTSVFRVTRVLDRPAHVLVDPDGIVRHLDRPGVGFSAQLRSLLLNYRSLSGPAVDRETIVRSIFPRADSIAVRVTSETTWLGVDAFELGLSMWYGEAFGAGRRLGVVFPTEYDPQCNTCDLLYLAVGVGRGRRIVGVKEIEPIIALGERISADALFERLIGINREEGLAQIPSMLSQKKAEVSIRSLVRVVLTLSLRIPAELGMD